MNNNDLALERTKLANERTFLAYSRTAIMLFATGATFLKLFAQDLAFQIIGWVMLIISVLVFGYGLFSFTRISRRLRE
ncbi:MAG: DUF202 domain-containing protein [Tunicatimonas sp.]|uniref:DUF202 domain-containing protein n=1 Tax=Tunicatimonas sp. TaxID=1940096 RepID=UPI003C767EB2